MTPMHEQAADLLEILWRGIPADYKSRYRMSIWQQLEDQVRSAAYTSSLPRFISSICLKLQANLGRNQADRARIQEILNAGQDQPLLKLMRDETTVVVLMVRLRNQERRERWEAEIRAEEEADLDDPLFAMPKED